MIRYYLKTEPAPCKSIQKGRTQQYLNQTLRHGCESTLNFQRHFKRQTNTLVMMCSACSVDMCKYIQHSTTQAAGADVWPLPSSRRCKVAANYRTAQLLLFKFHYNATRKPFLLSKIRCMIG